MNEVIARALLPVMEGNILDGTTTRSNTKILWKPLYPLKINNQLLTNELKKRCSALCFTTLLQLICIGRTTILA